MSFRDRRDAGRQLAARLQQFAGARDAIVLALPRGGVPVAHEIATSLGLPLDVFVVRKLGLPWQPELAMGAIASGGVRVIEDEIVRMTGVTPGEIERVAAAEQAELERRERQYRGSRPVPKLAGRTVILVDDGLATGSSMRVAVQAVRAESPARIIVAVPVAPEDTCEMLSALADVVVCAATPEPFHSVGQWYDDFSPTTDDEVSALLRER